MPDGQLLKTNHHWGGDTVVKHRKDPGDTTMQIQTLTLKHDDAHNR